MIFLYTLATIIDRFNSPVLAGVLLVAGAAVLSPYSRSHALALVFSSVIAFSVGVVLKALFAVPRLDTALVAVTGYRFPSQHALVAGAFFGSLCVSALYALDSVVLKVLVVILALAGIGTVSWSRVFLHAHLPVDVVVGSVLGVAIALCIHIFVLKESF